MRCAVDYQAKRQRVEQSYREMASKFCYFIGKTIKTAFGHAGISGKRFDKADDTIYCEFGEMMEKYAGDEDSDKEKIASASVAILAELKCYKIDLDEYPITIRDEFAVYNPHPSATKRAQHERRVEFVQEYCADTVKAITAVYFKWLHDEAGFGAKRIAPIAKEIAEVVSEYLGLYVRCTLDADVICRRMVEGIGEA